MAQSTQAAQEAQPLIADKIPTGEYPLIDNDPHISRVIRYARPGDWAAGAAVGALSPALMLYWERVSPSFVGKGGFPPILRLSGAIGLTGMFMFVCSRSSHRFYGARENRREVEMDMREMVDKVKRGEPLYGKSEMSEYLQGVSHRNSRYSAVFAHVIPWPNLVNHPYHGVDTAKYYRQAELELEQERAAK
ncbi:NADH-ubiquinone oxidoreductase-like protein 21 kDa subunit [Aaosphaeria arxii CBS 175.79]|uniref:NADH-ubiquinone oxidoreductase-like protein 21 kDa subunit n=1 Tax=Aaosphaeria arxii CBS 175.79 TaxID=1450172 RepID=A0A6A5XSG7_9PLEO|nr:NADH-ubiquinone oxidoreductase-like protein 21 kDa subunit [Aaosphaeria arxii CBS 175.79]KAF2016248.1 NADH-ubiquinone oxidoreductase-like protein 21 kDa subunit [Aaosphaeria arxii CBS 175.79]